MCSIVAKGRHGKEQLVRGEHIVAMGQSDTQREDANAIRVELAQALVERKRTELGEHLLAAAVYGSVAHGAASTHSDVEVALVTDETVPYGDHWYLDRGIMVEYTCVSAERWLAAAHRIDVAWGVEADQNQHHLVLWDPDGYFPRLQAHARAVPDEAFAPALRESWWRAFEARGKFLNAAEQGGDGARIRYTGWQFAYIAALRIALYERRPYESGRTIWADVAARGYGMRALLLALESVNTSDIAGALENVWAQIRTWGMPDGEGE
jgi:kanamycin nucleotidyltransferase